MAVDLSDGGINIMDSEAVKEAMEGDLDAAMSAAFSEGAAAAEAEGGSSGEEAEAEQSAEAGAAEGQQEAGAEAGAAEDGEDGEEADGDVKDGEIQGLSERAREKINRKIAKQVRRRHEAEERAAAVADEAAAAKARAEAAEAALNGKTVEGAYALGFPPEYLSKDEGQLLTQAQKLGEARAWLLEHFDGYEGDGSEGDPSYTAAQVRRRYAEVDRALQKLSPRAETLRDERTKLMLADLKAGREARLARGAKKPGEAQKAPTRPPVLPGGGGASRKPLVSAGKAGTGFSAAAVMEDPSPGSLEKEFEKVFG